MPLRQTKYGGECPLGKFKIDIPAGAGCYTNDPVEACIDCNFADLSGEGFNLEKICQCPSDMSWGEYDRLKKDYAKTSGKLTKKGFLDYVGENRKKA
jgi:hypothetical protein